MAEHGLTPDAAGQRALNRAEWVVTEKVHGANLSFHSEGATLRVAKRKAFLAEDEAFFAYQPVRERLRDAVIALADELCEAREELALYGELCGGAYPHPEVPSAPGLQAIQTGVYYSPRLEFFAFDIAITGPEGRPRFLDYDDLYHSCLGYEIPILPPLARGSSREAWAYGLDFDSRVPAYLGLPDLPAGSNRAEGVVIRPAHELLVQTPRGPKRALVKRKHPSFSEDPSYHQASAWSLRPPGLDELEAHALLCLNANRLAAVRSKLGPGAEAVALMRALVDDVWETLGELCDLAGLSPEDRRLLDAVLEAEAEAVVAL